MKTIYVGDCGVDEYNGQLYAGGCGLNTAFYAQKVGLSMDLVSCVGNDKESQIPLNVCHKIGLKTDYIYQFPGKTPQQKIEVLPNGEKKLVGYNPGVLSKFKLQKKDLDFIGKHQMLITVYYLQIEKLFSQLLESDFKGLKVIDFMDGNDFDKDIDLVKKYADRWDIGYFGLSVKDEKLINNLKELADDENKLVLITLGKEGSWCYWQKKKYWQKAENVKAVDTTGCGDAYLAGFLSKFAKQQGLQQSMLCGSRLASEAARCLGAFVVQ